jgi:hypothetical protein
MVWQSGARHTARYFGAASAVDLNRLAIDPLAERLHAPTLTTTAATPLPLGTHFVLVII